MVVKAISSNKSVAQQAEYKARKTLGGALIGTALVTAATYYYPAFLDSMPYSTGMLPRQVSLVSHMGLFGAVFAKIPLMNALCTATAGVIASAVIYTSEFGVRTIILAAKNAFSRISTATVQTRTPTHLPPAKAAAPKMAAKPFSAVMVQDVVARMANERPWLFEPPPEIQRNAGPWIISARPLPFSSDLVALTARTARLEREAEELLAPQMPQPAVVRQPGITKIVHRAAA